MQKANQLKSHINLSHELQKVNTINPASQMIASFKQNQLTQNQLKMHQALKQFVYPEKKWVFPEESNQTEKLPHVAQHQNEKQTKKSILLQPQKQGSGQDQQELSIDIKKKAPKKQQENPIIFFDRQQFAREIQSQQVTTKNSKKNNATLLYWARMYYQQKKYSQSIHTYLKLVENNPLSDQYYQELANVYYAIKNIDAYNSVLLRLYKVFMYKNNIQQAQQVIHQLQSIGRFNTGLLEQEIQHFSLKNKS